MQFSELFSPVEEIQEDENSQLLNYESRQSLESLPPGRQIFGQLRSNLNNSEEATIFQSFLCDLFVYMLVISVLISISKDGSKCGIPVMIWNIVHFAFFAE